MQPVTTTARQNGFTLVELLVVLTVIGLIIALAPVAMYRTMPSLELRTTTRELAAALRNTRSAAIRDNREMALTLDVEAGWYRLDGREGEQEIDPEIELKLLTATIEAENENVGRIRFFPDGAGKDMTFGTTIEPQHVVLVDFPKESVPAGYYATVDTVLNQTTKVFLVAGEPIALLVGAVRTADLDAFVPVEAEPSEPVDHVLVVLV